MTKKLTAQQQLHINNSIREHKVEFLQYNGNILGWHHYIEFPITLFPEFNEEYLSNTMDQITSYSDSEIKHIRCVRIDYDHRIIWIDLISHSNERIRPICPTSLIEGIYADAQKLGSQCMDLLCKVAYNNSLTNAIKYCEDELLLCGEEELRKLVPYDAWLDHFIKMLVSSIWSNSCCHSYSPTSKDDWQTDPPLSHHHIAPPLYNIGDVDYLPF